MLLPNLNPKNLNLYNALIFGLIGLGIVVCLILMPFPNLEENVFGFIASAVFGLMASYYFYHYKKSSFDAEFDYSEMSPAPPNHPSNRFPRIWGVLLLIASFYLGKWQIYDPLHERRSEFWISRELIGFTFLLGAYAISLILFGSKPNQWLRIDPKNVGWKKAALLIVMGIIILLITIYVERLLASHGYRLR